MRSHRRSRNLHLVESSPQTSLRASPGFCPQRLPIHPVDTALRQRANMDRPLETLGTSLKAGHYKFLPPSFFCSGRPSGRFLGL
jgi:hypothetical protein